MAFSPGQPNGFPSTYTVTMLATAFVPEHTMNPYPSFWMWWMMSQRMTSSFLMTRLRRHRQACSRSLSVSPLLAISNFLPVRSRWIASLPVGLSAPSVEEVHELILWHVVGNERDQMMETAGRRLFRKRHPICFTHADLRPWNVLVQDGRLSGLMDFGNSGWYPEYWEHATATLPLW